MTDEKTDGETTSKKKMIHYVYSQPKPEEKSGVYGFFKWFLISIVAIIVLSFSGTIIESTNQFLYRLKPISVLPFEKMETKRPAGNICHVELDTTVVHQGIVWHENKIDIYKSMRFDKLIKTIELPGAITNVKCQYLSGYADPDSYKFGIADYPGIGLAISVEYDKGNSRRLRIYGVDGVRFQHYNYMTNRFFNRRAADELWQTVRGVSKDKNSKIKLPEKYDSHPKNPFEYVEQKDDFELNGMIFLTCSSYDFIYLHSTDGKMLFNREIGKNTATVATFKETMIWSCFFQQSYMPVLTILGFDGRYFYSLRPDSQKEFDKTDTGLDGILEQSSITPNTCDGFISEFTALAWNGKGIIGIWESKSVRWSLQESFKTPGIGYRFYERTDGSMAYLAYDVFEKGVAYTLDCRAIGCFDSPYYISDPNQNTIIKESVLNRVSLFIVEKKDKTPLLAVRNSICDSNALYTFGTRNIDETIEDVYMTREDERPVFYFFGKSSIFRWENSADGLINLKPRLLLLDETKLNAID